MQIRYIHEYIHTAYIHAYIYTYIYTIHIGILPGTTIYVALGAIARSNTEGDENEGGSGGGMVGNAKKVLSFVGVISTAILLKIGADQATKALEDAGFRDDDGDFDGVCDSDNNSDIKKK